MEALQEEWKRSGGNWLNGNRPHAVPSSARVSHGKSGRSEGVVSPEYERGLLRSEVERRSWDKERPCDGSKNEGAGSGCGAPRGPYQSLLEQETVLQGAKDEKQNLEKTLKEWETKYGIPKHTALIYPRRSTKRRR
jgi:hypothetical protein